MPAVLFHIHLQGLYKNCFCQDIIKVNYTPATIHCLEKVWTLSGTDKMIYPVQNCVAENHTYSPRVGLY